MNLGLGFKPRVGRAVMAVVGEDAGTLRVLERAEVPLLPPGEWAPYHAADGLAPDEARRKVISSIKAARRMAREVIEGVIERCTAEGHSLRGCGVLVGSAPPPWTTEEIRAVHVRMHKVEGEMFRGILVDAAQASGLAVIKLSAKTPLDAACRILGLTRAQLDAKVKALGKQAGPPWGAHEKEAAAAALTALAAARA